MLYVVLAMVFSGAVGDCLLSVEAVEAYHEGNRAIAIRQAQCHERMQAEAWPRGFMLDATLLLVRLLVRRLNAPMSVQAWSRGVMLDATLPRLGRLNAPMSVQAWSRGVMLEATLPRVGRLIAPRVCRHGPEA